MAIKWKDSYTVQNAEIDQQHKQLLELGAKLYTIAGKTKDFADLEVVFKELTDYTKYHFQYEEAYMTENGYTKLEAHKLEHHRFIDSVNNFISDASADTTSDTALKLIIYITGWVSQHIVHSDKDYSKEFSRSSERLQ